MGGREREERQEGERKERVCKLPDEDADLQILITTSGKVMSLGGNKR